MENKKDLVDENIFAGIVGAFLFSLAGGILWYILYQVGFLAGISGVVGVFAAVRGYSFFARKQSVKGVIISVVIAALVLIVAWYVCLANDLYEACKEWYAAGEIDYMPTFFETVATAYSFLAEPEIALAYLKDLGLGLLLCAWASYSSVKSSIKAAKAGQIVEGEFAQEDSAIVPEDTEATAETENETV